MSGHHHSVHPHHDAQHHRTEAEHMAPWVAPEPLERGSGQGSILYFDAFSGLAGDMTMAALLDLGVPRQVFDEVVHALGLPGVSLNVSNTRAGAIGATAVDVVVAESQPARTYSRIRDLLGAAKLRPEVCSLAQAMFLRLGRAEAKVHRVLLEDVHFHEVGSVDAIVDIVGSAAGLDHLGATVECSPLPMGSGLVMTQHGAVPLPAPATLECLAGVPTVPAGIAGELVTPTGATIIATAARRFGHWPCIAMTRVGWGAGTKRWPDRPNALRVVLGESVHRSEPSELVLLEANVDDMSGEVAAHALDAIRAAGAVDAWSTALLMKKGRPGLLLSALVKPSSVEALASVFLRETTTIGVRFARVERIERPRRIVIVPTEYGDIPVKVSEGSWHPRQAKPEFDAASRAALAHSVPVRTVLDAAIAAYLRNECATTESPAETTG